MDTSMPISLGQGDSSVLSKILQNSASSPAITALEVASHSLPARVWVTNTGVPPVLNPSVGKETGQYVNVLL